MTLKHLLTSFNRLKNGYTLSNKQLNITAFSNFSSKSHDRKLSCNTFKVSFTFQNN